MFGADFRTADVGDKTVSFTVLESRLLEFLTRHSGQTLSRGQIVEAIYDGGSDRSDRSIDFLVNRLRRKLGDDPRAPRFIETRYGGGYVWLGPTARTAAARPLAGIAVIGPVIGLDHLEGERPSGLAFAEALALAFEAELGAAVGVATTLDASELAAAGGLRFQVELSFFRHGATCECILTGRSLQSGLVFFIERRQLQHEGPPWRANARMAAGLVPEILAARWRKDVEYFATTRPLPVAIHDAAIADHTMELSPDEIDRFVPQASDAVLADPEAAMLRASHLFSRVVAGSYKTFLQGLEACQAIDAEIQKLVQAALPWAQDRPDQAMLAAKLLYYVSPYYKEIALQLAADAHRRDKAIAASLATYGQLKAFVGETDEAIALLRQAVTLAPAKSRFRHYVQILLCQALIADERREELEPVRAEVYAFHPVARIFYEQVMTDPDRPSLLARGGVFALTRAVAMASLRYNHHISVRLFQRPEHREASVRAMLSLYVRRFGRQVVPPEVAEAVPRLLGA